MQYSDFNIHALYHQSRASEGDTSPTNALSFRNLISNVDAFDTIAYNLPNIYA